MIGHMGNVAYPPSRSTWGRVMGHMGNRAHGQWYTWAMGHMDIRGRMMGHMGDRAHGQWPLG